MGPATLPDFTRVLVLLLLSAGWLLGAPPPAAGSVPSLLAPVESPLSAPEPGTLKQHAVTVRELLVAPGTPALSVELFDGQVIQIVRQGTRQNPSGSRSWWGRVAGDPFSQVVLVSREGIVVGTFRTEGRLYLLSYVAGGLHRLAELDESSPVFREQPPTEVVLAQPASIELAAEASGPRAAVGADGLTVVDLMVVYTPTAAAGAGGTVAIENFIDLGVTETNLSYATSGIDIDLRLAQVQQVSYTESGSTFTDRDRLRINGDGFMDEVHGLRDQVGADIVHLIIDSPGCGVAYIMNPVSPSFEEFAFCVTMRACISPNYTFAHEMGHLQAARHDYFVDPTVNGPFSYNHGYVDPLDRWRSIMAYSNDCGGCQRQLFWSNPDRNHPVTGNATGVAVGQPNAADNRLTLNTTAAVIAAFRENTTSIFADSFESGQTGSWTATVGQGP